MLPPDGGRHNPTDDAHYDPDRYRLAIPTGDDWILVRGCFRCEAAKRLCVLEPNNKRCKSCAKSRKFCGRKLTCEYESARVADV